MSTRPLPILVVALAAAAVGAVPAAAQTPTDRPAPGALPGACADQSAPASAFTRRAARRARRTRLLRGTAADVGCGLDRVEISVLRRHGQALPPADGPRAARPPLELHPPGAGCPSAARADGRSASPSACRPAAYRIRTRAFDFAGNAERPHGRRVKLAKRHRSRH